MIGAILKLVGVDLQSQLASLRAQAEDFKSRATDEVKRQVADASITIGLALVSLVFGLATIFVGLIALYLRVAMANGPFVALAAVALTTVVIAAIAAAVAAARGRRPSPKRPSGYVAPPAYVARAPSTAGGSQSIPPLPSLSAGSPHSFADVFMQNLTHRTAAATNEALDAAAEIVRKGPREAILATLGVAVVIGLFIGRRR